jgi:hypothetical protein
MLWSGIVYRNNKFAQEGTIDVMLWQKYIPNGTSSVWVQPFYKLVDKVKGALGIGTSAFGGSALTVSCLVATGMGNGYNSGMVNIPQVGTTGIVAEIENSAAYSNSGYIWLGGLYGNTQYGEKITLPSDDTVSDEIDDLDEAYISNYSGANGDKVVKDTISDSNYIKKGAFVIKTKTNDIEDYEKIDSEKVDWKNILAENTLVLDQDKAFLRHHINDYDNNKRIGIEQLVMNKDQTTLKRKINKDSLLEQTLKMDDDQVVITLKSEGNDAETTVKLGNDGNVEINTTGEIKVNAKKNMSFQSDEDMKFEAKGKMELVSSDLMKIDAKNQNLAKIVDNLAQAVATLTTYGSPSTQSVQPSTIEKAQQVKTSLGEGYTK